MTVVVALGGNALLERGQRPDAEIQQRNVRRAVRSIASVAARHEVVITHGNGPQVGLLAAESADDRQLSRPYPLSSVGAETQGLIGFWLAAALRDELPGREVVAVVTQVVVDPLDPAFSVPTKFVGSACSDARAAELTASRGWMFARDGGRMRRVVPSPEPIELVEFRVIRALLEQHVIVVCAGGGGIPVSMGPDGRSTPIEAVVDKDLTSALLAGQLDAEALLLVTDVAGVERDHGTPQASVIRSAGIGELRAAHYPAGSMGPKVEAACRFAERTGRRAVIGPLDAVGAMLEGSAGTVVCPAAG